MKADELRLAAVRREAVGRTPEQVRRAGYIPAVLYGHGVANMNIAVETRIFEKLLPALSSSTLMTLTTADGGEARRVLVHAVQRHPLTGRPIHADFYAVILTEKIRAHVPLVFEGISPAVKEHGGTLLKNIDDVEVQALPQDLPEHLVVDISRLVTFESRLHVRDVAVSSGVEILQDLEEVVAVVTPPRTDAELQELATEVEEKAGEIKTEAEEKRAAEEAQKAEAAEGPEKKGIKGEE